MGSLARKIEGGRSDVWGSGNNFSWDRDKGINAATSLIPLTDLVIASVTYADEDIATTNLNYVQNTETLTIGIPVVFEKGVKSITFTSGKAMVYTASSTTVKL